MRATRLALALIVLPAVTLAQESTQHGEWPAYSGDVAGTRYSPLDHINGENFGDLEIAWRFKTDNFGPRPEYNFQSTPLMVGGVLYTTAGSRRAVVAIDAATGEVLWTHRLDEGERGAAAMRRLSGRGLAYWNDGRDGQIVYVTPGYRLIALNSATGRRVRNFGTDGIVDLKQNMDQELDPVHGEVGLHATPLVVGNTIIVGAAGSSIDAPRSMKTDKAYVRGFDARTGERRWIFHTIPGADEFGNDTWLNDSWRYTGNTGVWGQISADLELGIAYLPTEMPTNDYYGGHRHGDNLFADSLVAVDIDTGERLWHFQFIHHDVWDWDIPCAPILADITVDGLKVKAVAQPTKQGWLYVFDRVTGEPIWPIEERPVPPSDVPGELLSPTQPFPTKPPPYERQRVGIDDLVDFTPELRTQAAAIMARFHSGPIYTPPVASNPDGPLATLMLPADVGGVNWPGGSLDPETGIAYLYSSTELVAMGLVRPKPEQSDMEFVLSATVWRTNAPDAALNIEGVPIIKPPWGRITAIDLNAGDILWQIAHGETPDHIREHPLLEGVTVPRTGRAGRIGTLVTKTLVVAGEAGTFTTPSGVEGAMLRAYDKRTGQEVGAVYMPAPQTGSPMTYAVEGRQYIVVAVSGGGHPGELLAYRLPE